MTMSESKQSVAEAPVQPAETASKPVEVSERDNLIQSLAAHDSRGELGSGLSERSQVLPLTVDVPKEGKPIEAQVEPVPDAQAKTEPAEESKYAKAKDRLGKQWGKLTEEKEVLKREREAAATEKAEAESFKTKALQEVKEARQNADIRPESYEEVAERFAEEGRDDLAKAARDKAAAMRDSLKKERAEFERNRAETAWAKNFQELVNVSPELATDGSELNSAVKHILKQRPVLQTYPDGIKDAVEVARFYIEGKKAQEITKERDSLLQKVQELEKKLQPGGASASPIERSKQFDSLGSDAQKEYLLSRFRESDDMALSR